MSSRRSVGRRGKRKGGKVPKASVAVVRRALASIAEKKWVDHIIADYDMYNTGQNSKTYLWRPISNSGADTTTTGAAQDNLVGCAQSAGVNGRTGMKIHAKYLVIRIACEMGKGGGTGGTSVPFDTTGVAFSTNYPYGLATKFAVVLDRDPNGDSGPVPGNIWVADNGGNIAQMSQRNHDYAARYRILKEFTMTMSPGVMCPCTMSVFVPLNLEIEFNNTTDTVSTVLKNRVQIFRSQNVGVVDDTVAKCFGSVRYRGEVRCVFTDV